jgi:hypothetical protein
MHLKDQSEMKDIIDEVNFNDQKRDYSVDGLSQDEKLEVSLFHSLK